MSDLIEVLGTGGLLERMADLRAKFGVHFERVLRHELDRLLEVPESYRDARARRETAAADLAEQKVEKLKGESARRMGEAGFADVDVLQVATAIRRGIFHDVSRERDRQDAFFGPKSIASVSDPFRCVTILAEEVGEVAAAVEQTKPLEYRAELIQVAAVAVAMVEAVDRGVVQWGRWPDARPAESPHA